MTSRLLVDKIEGKTTSGTIQMPAGHIIQTAYSSTDTKIASTSSQADVTLMTADAFTPKFANSHILIQLNMHFGYMNPNGGLQVVRAISGGSTTYGIGDATVDTPYSGGDGFWVADEFVLSNTSSGSDTYTIVQMGGCVIDTDHNTTSAITYTLRTTSNDAVYFNRQRTNATQGNARSSITLMEIAQ